ADIASAGGTGGRLPVRVRVSVRVAALVSREIEGRGGGGDGLVRGGLEGVEAAVAAGMGGLAAGVSARSGCLRIGRHAADDVVHARNVGLAGGEGNGGDVERFLLPLLPPVGKLRAPDPPGGPIRPGSSLRTGPREAREGTAIAVTSLKPTPR